MRTRSTSRVTSSVRIRHGYEAIGWRQACLLVDSCGSGNIVFRYVYFGAGSGKGALVFCWWMTATTVGRECSFLRKTRERSSTAFVGVLTPLKKPFRTTLPPLQRSRSVPTKRRAYAIRCIDTGRLGSRSLSVASSATGPVYPQPTRLDDPNLLDLRRAPRRRVCLVVEPTPFTHVSGYSNRFNELLKHLKEAGDEVLIVTPDNSPDAPTEVFGYPVITIRGFKFALYPRITLSIGFGSGMVFGRPSLLQRVRDFDPDLIHLATPGFLVFAILLMARILRKPLVASYHTHLPMYAKTYGLGLLVGLAWMLMRFCLNRADLTLATSPQICAELRHHGIERVDLWRKGINTERFHPRFRDDDGGAMRSRLTGGHPEAPLLIYVGRLGAEKNLLSLRSVLERCPLGTRLAFVGDGPFADAVRRHFASLPVVMAGQLHGDELSRAFACADVFLMPSESETLGFVILEAMASGVPVVATAAGGIPDLILHGDTGFLYGIGDVDKAALYVNQLLKDPELRQRMGAAARREAERWSWRSATAWIRNVQYHRAMNNFRFRALGGLGLPRSLSWMRWIRRQLARAFFKPA
jgi:sulfoquinovosyltransferase